MDLGSVKSPFQCLIEIHAGNCGRENLKTFKKLMFILLEKYEYECFLFFCSFFFSQNCTFQGQD